MQFFQEYKLYFCVHSSFQTYYSLKCKNLRSSEVYQQVKILYSKIVNFIMLCIFMYYLYFLLSQNN